jgi:threonine dehydrogenase-like Zn-dependent dehydrogenase
MRPYLTVPTTKLHRTGKATLDQLALVEMLCIGQHAVNRSFASPTDRALILGTGPIGLSVLTFLQNRTQNVAVADISETRLEFCREAFGIEETILVEPGQSLEPSVRDAFGGELPDLLFDATGNRDSMASTFDLAAHGARIVFVGLFQGEVRFDDPNFHRRELTLLASRNATAKEFGEVISAIETRAIDTSAWVTHRMALADVPAEFPKTIADPSLRKAIIDCD